MGRPGSQRWQSMRFVGGQGAESKPEPNNDPEPEPGAPCQELDPLSTVEEKPLSMRQWMRWHNCKTYELTNQVETYPTIRPTMNRCYPSKNLGYIDDAMEANQCGRMFQMGKDDVLAVWNQSPGKETLAWYGIGSRAGAYRNAVAKSLKAASPRPKKPKQLHSLPPFLKQKVVEPRGAYVLDRVCLKAKLDKMPNVRRSLHASNAFSWLHCPAPVDPDHPFGEQSEKMSIVEPPRKRPEFPKRGLRRKHWYCPPRPMDKAEEDNKCIQYEKAAMGMRPVLKLEVDTEDEIKTPEPKNYDELFKSLERCFVQNPDGNNDLCEAYEKCCKDPGDPPSQGCNEFTPEAAGGGKLHDNNADNVGKGKKGGGDDDGGGKGDDIGKGKGDEKKVGKRVGKGDGEGDDKEDGEGDGKGDGKGKADRQGNDQGDGKGGGKKGDGKGDDQGASKGGAKEDAKGSGKGDGKKDGKTSLRDDPGDYPRETRPSVYDGTDVPKGVHDHMNKSTQGSEELTKLEPTTLPSAGSPKLTDIDNGPDGLANKNTKKNKGKKKRKKKKYLKKVNKDCPCEICCLVAKVEESPLIQEMRRRNEERKIRDYLHQMRHRQYMECKVSKDPRAPQHKCEDLEPDTLFCHNPRVQIHLDRVQAIQQLQLALQRGNTRCEYERICPNVDNLLSRLHDRLARDSHFG